MRKQSSPVNPSKRIRLISLLTPEILTARVSLYSGHLYAAVETLAGAQEKGTKTYAPAEAREVASLWLTEHARKKGVRSTWPLSNAKIASPRGHVKTFLHGYVQHGSRFCDCAWTVPML